MLVQAKILVQRDLAKVCAWIEAQTICTVQFDFEIVSEAGYQGWLLCKFDPQWGYDDRAQFALFVQAFELLFGE